MSEEKRNLSEEALGLFLNSSKNSGEEEILNIASNFARQLSCKQIQALLRLEMTAKIFDDNKFKKEAEGIRYFCKKYLEYKIYNQSDLFIMKALEHISLRKFIGEGVKVNIDKSG